MRMKHTVSPTNAQASCHVWVIRTEDSWDGCVLTELTLDLLTGERVQYYFKFSICLSLRGDMSLALNLAFNSLRAKIMVCKLSKSSCSLSLISRLAYLCLSDWKNVAKSMGPSTIQGSGAALNYSSVRRSLLYHKECRTTMTSLVETTTLPKIAFYCRFDSNPLSNRPVFILESLAHFLHKGPFEALEAKIG
jgi:hypothetical protein